MRWHARKRFVTIWRFVMREFSKIEYIGFNMYECLMFHVEWWCELSASCMECSTSPRICSGFVIHIVIMDKFGKLLGKVQQFKVNWFG